MKPIITKTITPISDGVGIASLRCLYGRQTEIRFLGILVYRKRNLSLDNCGIFYGSAEVEMLQP